MAADPLDALRLTLMQEVLPVGMAVVERVSHRVAVMYLGEIVEIGPRQSVINNPAHPYTRKLMAAVPVPDPDAGTIELNVRSYEAPATLSTAPIRVPFSLRNSHE